MARGSTHVGKVKTEGQRDDAVAEGGSEGIWSGNGPRGRGTVRPQRPGPPGVRPGYGVVTAQVQRGRAQAAPGGAPVAGGWPRSGSGLGARGTPQAWATRARAPARAGETGPAVPAAAPPAPDPKSVIFLGQRGLQSVHARRALHLVRGEAGCSDRNRRPRGAGGA